MKKNLIIMVVMLCFSISSFAEENENSFDKVLLQSIEKNEISDANFENIPRIDEIMWSQHFSGDGTNAIKTATYLLELNKAYLGEEDVNTGYAYAQRGTMYSWYYAPQLAIKDLEKAAEILKNYPEETELKQRELEALIHLKVVTEENNKAYEYAKKLYEINKKEKSIKDIYHEQGDVYSVIQDYDNALKYYSKYYNELKKLPKNEYEDFFYYMQVARFYKNQGKCKLAAENIKKAEEILPRLYDDNNEKKIQLNLLKVEFYEQYLDNEKIKELLDESLKLSEAVPEKTMYKEIQTSLSYYYKDKKQVKQFKATQKKIAEIEKKLPKESLSYIFRKEQESELYQNLGDIKAATELATKTLNDLEPVKDIAPVYYGKFIRQLFYINQKRKNPIQAKIYLDKMFEIYKKADTEDSIAFVDINKRAGEFYASQNKNEEAVTYFNKALKLAEKFNLNREKTDIYSKLGHAYGKLNEEALAIASADKSIEIAKIGNDEYDSNVYMYLLNKYYILNEMKKYNEATELFNKIEQDEDKVTGNTRMFKCALYTAKGWRERADKNYEAAYRSGETALKYADHFWEKEGAYFMLYKSYKAANDLKKAAIYKKLANL